MARTAKRPKFQHRLHAVIYPAPDLPGLWIGHCLELDTMAQGESPAQAMDLLAEGIHLSADENIKDGKPPLAFRSAPAEAWAQYAEAEDGAVRILRIDTPRVEDEVTITPHIARAS